jgi:predicted phosphodiesterase
MTEPLRIAIVSDVHGNMMALDAVAAALNEHGPFDQIIGGGDYISGGAFPKEVMEFLWQAGWNLVRGNSDEWLVDLATEGRIPATNYPPSGLPNQIVKDQLLWNAGHLSEDDLEFLGTRPLTWTVDGPSGQKLVFAHSTPTSTHPVQGPDDPDEVFMPFFAETGASVYLYGHIHYAWLRDTPAGTVGCVGAVGLPFDGDHRPCFMIATDDGSGWSLEHHRIAYDHEAYAEALMQSGIPHAEGQVKRVLNAGA